MFLSRLALLPLALSSQAEPRIAEHPRSLETLLTRAHSCQKMFMSEYERSAKIPERTIQLLDSLVRASGSIPREVELKSYLSTPILCRRDVAPILPSSRCFVDFMKTQTLAGASILDFGSGCGILSIMARKFGGKVVDAIDINPAAVAATKANARRCGIAGDFSAKQSNGFAAVNARYDLVLANLPMIDAESYAGVLFGLFDPHFNLHMHFFENLTRHLKPGGSAIICHSEFQEDWPFSRVESLLRANRLAAHLDFKQTVENVDWQLYRISPAVPA